MATYKHNRFHKAAFCCWGLGAGLVAIPFVLIFALAEKYGEKPMPYLAGAIGLGVLVLATGGTLHKVGTGRERQD